MLNTYNVVIVQYKQDLAFQNLVSQESVEQHMKKMFWNPDIWLFNLITHYKLQSRVICIKKKKNSPEDKRKGQTIKSKENIYSE